MSILRHEAQRLHSTPCSTGNEWTWTHWRLGSTLRPKGTHLGLQKAMWSGTGADTRADLTGVRSTPESGGHSHASHPRAPTGGSLGVEAEPGGFHTASLRG